MNNKSPEQLGDEAAANYAEFKTIADQVQYDQEFALIAKSPHWNDQATSNSAVGIAETLDPLAESQEKYEQIVAEGTEFVEQNIDDLYDLAVEEDQRRQRDHKPENPASN